MKRLNVRFDQRAISAIKNIITCDVDQQLSGLSPAERGEILNNILITQNSSGSSLKVHIASKTAVLAEFGTRIKPARPWGKKLQRKIASPIRSVLANLNTPKR